MSAFTLLHHAAQTDSRRVIRNLSAVFVAAIDIGWPPQAVRYEGTEAILFLSSMIFLKNAATRRLWPRASREATCGAKRTLEKMTSTSWTEFTSDDGTGYGIDSSSSSSREKFGECLHECLQLIVFSAFSQSRNVVWKKQGIK